MLASHRTQISPEPSQSLGWNGTCICRYTSFAYLSFKDILRVTTTSSYVTCRNLTAVGWTASLWCCRTYCIFASLPLSARGSGTLASRSQNSRIGLSSVPCHVKLFSVVAAILSAIRTSFSLLLLENERLLKIEQNAYANFLKGTQRQPLLFPDVLKSKPSFTFFPIFRPARWLNVYTCIILHSCAISLHHVASCKLKYLPWRNVVPHGVVATLSSAANRRD